MSDLDYLNYKPDFKRDKKEKTGWIQEEEAYVSESESEEVHKGKELDITVSIKEYNKFKEDFKIRVEELEKNLKSLKIPVDETIEKALNESEHTSVFSPKSYRKLFNEKESSVGEYLIGILEKKIESEHGDIEWEIFTEYLEIEEEISVLDFYIQKILFPIISSSDLTLSTEKEIRELEKEWVERTINNITDFNIGEISYEIAMTTTPKRIAQKRDKLHDLEIDKMLSTQEINQVESSLLTVDQKRVSLESVLKRIDDIIDFEINEDIINELTELTKNKKEEKESLKNTVILIKQSIDQDNNEKRKIKQTRRNLFSQSKQKRIVEEYSSINFLLRENSLPAIHYMKSFQDNASEELSNLFNQSAKSIDRNYEENKEKAYETFMLQISTSQTRMNRLEYVESKQKSRLMFQELINKEKETN